MSNFMEFLSSAEVTASLEVLIVIGLSIIVGILAGNSAVVVFNRMPAHWLCDYKEEPSEELKQNDRQRIKSHPWKMAFSALFALCAINMALYDWQYAIAAIISIWALLIIAIADKKYMIIPDQFVLLLAITAVGYVPYHSSFLSPLWGALIGGGCMLLIGIAGKLLFKKEALGFGDVKLFAAIGFITGPFGIAIILVACSFLSCLDFAVLMIRKKVKRTDMMPLAPYAAFSTTFYLVFL
ncbi:MAG: A24 family peptidase [Clostridiales bacterium]|nr:A24 family peptidase [Clostridiales bacterium]